ncbi:MAG: branched-chain amino acid ABC transporter permease [Rhizobiales bacterium]|nr:branched-chain amino acid ABC transporter permease [Hyphomicrobiales bacterium]
MDYYLFVMTLALINLALVLSFDLVIGWAHLFSLAHAGFVGVGAYSVAILSTRYGWPMPICIGAGTFLAAVFTMVVSIPAARVRDDYLVVATLGLQMILTSYAVNSQFTGGDAGVANVPSLFGVDSRWGKLGISAVFVAAVAIVYLRLVRSSFGRSLHIIREEEVTAKSMGRNVFAIKVSVFLISGALAGFVGGFYASFLNYVSADFFNIFVTVQLLTMLIVGGMASFFWWHRDWHRHHDALA